MFEKNLQPKRQSDISTTTKANNLDELETMQEAEQSIVKI